MNKKLILIFYWVFCAVLNVRGCKKLYKKSDWLINVPSNEPTCICCDKTEYDKIAYNLDERCLCFDCFINYNEDLAEEYTKESKCLIKINK